MDRLLDRLLWIGCCGQATGQTAVDRPLWTDCCGQIAVSGLLGTGSEPYSGMVILSDKEPDLVPGLEVLDNWLFIQQRNQETLP